LSIRAHPGLPLRLRRLGGRGSVRGSPCGKPARLCPPFFLLRGYPSSAKPVVGHPVAAPRLRSSPRFLPSCIRQRNILPKKTRGLRRFRTSDLRSGDPPASSALNRGQRGNPRGTRFRAEGMRIRRGFPSRKCAFSGYSKPSPRD